MEINLIQILFQALNFGLLLFILTKFLYKPVLKLLEERNQKIEAGLKAAEDNLEEKAHLEELKTKSLIKAETAAAQVLEQARKQAESTGRDIIADAKDAAQVAVKKEHELLRQQLESERLKLKGEIADLVVDTTKSVLADTLTLEQQRTIVSHQIKQLKKVKL